MRSLTINGQESTVTSSYNLRCIGSRSINKTNQLSWFVFCFKKFIFGLDKSNFNDKIVSFMHLGGLKKICDLFGIQK